MKGNFPSFTKGFSYALLLQEDQENTEHYVQCFGGRGWEWTELGSSVTNEIFLVDLCGQGSLYVGNIKWLKEKLDCLKLIIYSWNELLLFIFTFGLKKRTPAWEARSLQGNLTYVTILIVPFHTLPMLKWMYIKEKQLNINSYLGEAQIHRNHIHLILATKYIMTNISTKRLITCNMKTESLFWAISMICLLALQLHHHDLN